MGQVGKKPPFVSLPAVSLSPVTVSPAAIMPQKLPRQHKYRRTLTPFLPPVHQLPPW
jgi:hypothetical protein